MLNIYAPNIDNPDFFSQIVMIEILASSPNVIIGGDFNCHSDPTQDKLSTIPAPTIASLQTMND